MSDEKMTELGMISDALWKWAAENDRLFGAWTTTDIKALASAIEQRLFGHLREPVSASAGQEGAQRREGMEPES